ncbi:helix-turn-helix domain-containing protein [Capnocytophaga canimorsus]|uniref:helix-turn-helix domain-containing protein n=1 Tax=Capnocytophaga canimorsus TaxID=28188 RepID=UPI000BB1760F|nr:helix-turn-helix transcriptional regulator [Capnocytophaga canimorsus]ATA76370.1 transcriptional regulator [Capnocytophaga canimorsus]PJI79585.1 hypothetical protein CLV61_1471 [Capnocytophaga canimorsus]STA71510.1 Uncharacterised protein [Capnocytophaga canimorsus]
MVNTSDFSKRLQLIMDYYELTASAFADSLQIQRSSISHLLSERNKPSLDFILKLVETYPEVDIFWITQGKGSFPPAPLEKIENSSKERPKSTTNQYQGSLFDTFSKDKEGTPNQVINALEENIPEKIIGCTKKQIKKIVFFYENNTFEVYENH